MLRSIFGTFQRFAWIFHSSLGLKEALVFFIPSVLMTIVRREWERL